MAMSLEANGSIRKIVWPSLGDVKKNLSSDHSGKLLGNCTKLIQNQRLSDLRLLQRGGKLGCPYVTLDLD